MSGRIDKKKKKKLNQSFSCSKKKSISH